jgi:hypothetical protein
MNRPTSNDFFHSRKETIMSDIVVHGVPGSPFMRAVQLGIEEKRVPYRVQAMGPSESEAYLKQNPFGRVRCSSTAISCFTRRRQFCAISMPNFPSRRCSPGIIARWHA